MASSRSHPNGRIRAIPSDFVGKYSLSVILAGLLIVIVWLMFAATAGVVVVTILGWRQRRFDRT